jgi:hypothetical protein
VYSGLRVTFGIPASLAPTMTQPRTHSMRAKPTGMSIFSSKSGTGACARPADS